MQHAKDLAQVFNNRGVKADFIVGDKNLTEDRKGVVEKLKSGAIQVLCNVNILIAGFDFPDLGCVLMGRPTKSLTLYMQAIGRGTRLKSKEFVDQFGPS